MFTGLVARALGAIQVLRNTMGRGGRVYRSAQISVTKVHSPMLLAL